jgi:hypothetical protein
MLKDYTSLYPEGLQPGYVIHHLATISGCALCLLMPMGLGLTTFNAVQCELGSALYSLRLALPSNFTRTVYYVSMTTSNILGVYLAWTLFSYPIPAFWRVIYAVLAVLIVALRTAALILDVQAELKAEQTKQKDR